MKKKKKKQQKVPSTTLRLNSALSFRKKAVL